MAFSDETIRLAWGRAGGRCECKKAYHNHPIGLCNKELIWENRGREAAGGAWKTHHRSSTGGGLSRSTSFSLTVTAAVSTFDFSLTNGGNRSVVLGGSVTNTITATLLSDFF